MNNNSSSLDEQIDRYTKQLLGQYLQVPKEVAPPTPPPTLPPTPPSALPTPPPTLPPPSTLPTPPATPAVTPADEYRRYTNDNPQRGILHVQTLTARNTYPVSGVKVIVSKVFDSGEYVIATQETDNAGKTEPLLLPAPDRSLSEQPGATTIPYAVYKLTVIHPGFSTIVALRLPVFSGESSMQALSMIPLSASPSGDTIRYISTQPSDL